MDKILFVDDDERILQAFKRRLYRKYKFHIANSGSEGLEKIEKEGPFAVVISDMQMPSMDGLTFLKEVAKQAPLTARIMLTGNADRQTAVSAVNEGQVFRYLNKPCTQEELCAAVDNALDYHRTLVAERELLENTLAGSVKLLVDILALNDPSTFKQTSVLRSAGKRLAKFLRHPNMWELDMTILLSSIGEVVLPPELRAKKSAGEELDDIEQTLFAQTPKVTKELLLNIPRMEHIANAIYYSQKNYDGSGFPKDGTKGDDIPYNARILNLLQHLISTADGHAPNKEIFDQLQEKANLLDPALLNAARKCFLDSQEANGVIRKKVETTIQDLKPGDILQQNLLTKTGKMAFSADHELTEALVNKIWQFHKLRELVEPVIILREFKQDKVKADAA